MKCDICLKEKNKVIKASNLLLPYRLDSLTTVNLYHNVDRTRNTINNPQLYNVASQALGVDLSRWINNNLETTRNLCEFLNSALIFIGRKDGFTEENKTLIINTVSGLLVSSPNFEHVCFECFYRKLRSICLGDNIKDLPRRDNNFDRDDASSSSYVVNMLTLTLHQNNLLLVKLQDLDNKFRTVNSLNSINQSVISKISRDVYKEPTEQDNINQSERIRRAYLMKKCGKKWLQHWRDMRQAKQEALAKMKRYKFFFTKAEIERLNWRSSDQLKGEKNIVEVAEIKRQSKINVSYVDTRRGKIFLGIMLTTPVLFYLSAKLWWWKYFLAWYHEPLKEEDWNWVEDEPEEEGGDNSDNNE